MPEAVAAVDTRHVGITPVARELGISRSGVFALGSVGALTIVTVGRNYFVTRQSLDHYKAERDRRASPAA